MSKLRSFIPLFILPLAALACGGGGTPAPAEATPTVTAPAAAAPSATVAAAAPSASASEAAAPTAAPKPSEPAAPVAAALKISTFQIAGVSISEITGAQLLAELKKRGWDAQALPETHVGKYEQVGLSARKDKSNKEVFTLAISRTAKTPTPITDATRESDFAPKSLQALYEKGGAGQVYDADSDVLVSMTFLKGGSTAAAKALLDAMVTQAK